jgi:hypothetical protein
LALHANKEQRRERNSFPFGSMIHPSVTRSLLVYSLPRNRPHSTIFIGRG